KQAAEYCNFSEETGCRRIERHFHFSRTCPAAINLKDLAMNHQSSVLVFHCDAMRASKFGSDLGHNSVRSFTVSNRSNVVRGLATRARPRRTRCRCPEGSARPA